MTVIPLRPRGTSPAQSTEAAIERPEDARALAPERTLPSSGISTPVRGTFRSPSGRSGTMTGSVRVERVVTTSGSLWVQGVFTGELLDADGSHIATSSRRHLACARIARDLEGAPTVVGPVQIDLLGLRVSVPAFVVWTLESD